MSQKIKLKWAVSIETGDKVLPDIITANVIFPDGNIPESGVNAVCDQINRSMVVQVERLKLKGGNANTGIK